MDGSKNCATSSSDVAVRAISSRNFLRANSRNFSKLSTCLSSLIAKFFNFSSSTVDGVGNGDGGCVGAIDVVFGGDGVVVVVVLTMLTSVVLKFSFFVSPLLESARLSDRCSVECADGDNEFCECAVIASCHSRCAEPKFGSA